MKIQVKVITSNHILDLRLLWQALIERTDFIAALIAEMVTFLIKVFHISTGYHYTVWDMTVQEAKHMSQFVGDNLFEAIEKQILILFHSILFVSKSVERCNTGFTVQRGLSENICEYGDTQIHPEQSYFLDLRR